MGFPPTPIISSLVVRAASNAQNGKLMNSQLSRDLRRTETLGQPIVNHVDLLGAQRMKLRPTAPGSFTVSILRRFHFICHPSVSISVYHN